MIDRELVIKKVAEALAFAWSKESSQILEKLADDLGILEDVRDKVEETNNVLMSEFYKGN